MSFLKNVVKAAGAIKDNFKGANGFTNALMNAAQIAQASDQIANLRNKLKEAKNDAERQQLESELREALSSFDHFRNQMNLDAEASAQARDRLSRIIGTDTEQSKHLFREKADTDCQLKIKGDQFELQVGRHLEEKGYFVFYNGMLRSEADQGVDLVAYDKRKRVARYIQCKNWERKTLNYNDITGIIKKMVQARISPTRVEMKRQEKEGWATSNQFDDSVFYKTEYWLVVPKRTSITPEANRKVNFGFVTIPGNNGSRAKLELLCYSNNQLEKWLHFD